MQHDVQRPGQFPRFYEAAKQRVEMCRFFAQCCRQAGACADVLFEFGDLLAHGPALETVGDHPQGLLQGNAGADQGCQLAGEQGDIQRRDGFACIAIATVMAADFTNGNTLAA